MGEFTEYFAAGSGLSKECTVHSSLVIKPGVKIYFHLSGFSLVYLGFIWGFSFGVFFSHSLFCGVGLTRFCTHLNGCKMFPRAVANSERFGLWHYPAPRAPQYFGPGTERTDWRLCTVGRGNCTLELKNVLTKCFSA